MTDTGLYPLFDSARNESWRELLPTLPKRQGQVLEALAKIGTGTFYDVANQLGWPVHSTVGRLSELDAKKIIHIVDYRHNATTGKTNSVYGIY